jgi:hypothetical protein
MFSFAHWADSLGKTAAGLGSGSGPMGHFRGPGSLGDPDSGLQSCGGGEETQSLPNTPGLCSGNSRTLRHFLPQLLGRQVSPGEATSKPRPWRAGGKGPAPAVQVRPPLRGRLRRPPLFPRGWYLKEQLVKNLLPHPGL